MKIEIESAAWIVTVLVVVSACSRIACSAWREASEPEGPAVVEAQAGEGEFSWPVSDDFFDTEGPLEWDRFEMAMLTKLDPHSGLVFSLGPDGRPEQLAVMQSGSAERYDVSDVDFGTFTGGDSFPVWICAQGDKLVPCEEALPFCREVGSTVFCDVSAE